MRSDSVVLLQPFMDDGFGLIDSQEPFSIEHLSSWCAVEALIIPIFPRASWVDAYWLDANFAKPFLKACCDELRSVVGTNKLRFSVFEEQWIQSFQHILIIHGGFDSDGESFTGIFIKHGEHFIRHPIAEQLLCNAVWIVEHQE